MFRIAKAMERAIKELGSVAIVQDRDGNIVTEDEQIKKRWGENLDQLLNEENPRGILELCDEAESPEMEIERAEVEKTLKRMKAGKAWGPTDFTSDMLLVLGDKGINWLTVLLKNYGKRKRYLMVCSVAY